MDSSDIEKQSVIVEALQNPDCFPHAVRQVRHIETHISHLLLTGQFAYKLKKPLDLGFLDFSTLENRRHHCNEEIRLNRRLAPEVYLDVVTVNGSPSSPRINGTGPVLEYAVRMRQFDPESTLDQLQERQALTSQHIESMADAVADFHERIPAASEESGMGSIDRIGQPVRQNFEQIESRISRSSEVTALLNSIRQWSELEFKKLASDFELRRKQGFVRECHGDLHLGNMAWHENRLLIFDCIEFNPDLRWIDVMSEIAFCFMDLMSRGHGDYAFHFLNSYLSRTGDFSGMKLLRFYAVYRAMVRAKVAFILATQSTHTPHSTSPAWQQGLDYLKLAHALAHPDKPMLVITHGLSGSGKTTFSQQLALQSGLIVLRSDVERKRLAGLDAMHRTESAPETGIYASDFSRRTYEHLAKLSELMLSASWNVLVDATFIARWQRELFMRLASQISSRFYILDFKLDEAILRQRVRARSLKGNDASEADESVLEHQLKTQEPLVDVEMELCLPATTVAEAVEKLKQVSGSQANVGRN